MIGDIKAVWPGERRINIIVEDSADHMEKVCYVFLPEGRWIAELCERHAWNGKTQPPPLVLTIDPKSGWGYKIVDCEPMGAGV